MKVKTVIIVNDFNYTQGGASKVAIDTAKALKEKGLNVIFFSAVNSEDEKIDGVQYVTTNQKEALKEKNRMKGIVNGIYNFTARKKLKELLLKLEKDSTVIHVHGWTKALSSSVFDIAFKMDFKVVLTLHDYFTACPNGGYFDYRNNQICHLKPLSWKCIKCNCDSRNYGFKIYRLIRQFVQNKVVRLNKKLENVISISQFSEDILKCTLEKNVRITRIYNPIDMDGNEEKVNLEKNESYLYVGRVSKEKGVDLFCQAITELDLKGIVVGNGEEKERLEKKYPNIEFVGWKNKKEVKEYMKRAKALIFPSKWYECAPLTIIEAQVLGIPCIVSECCAGSEFVTEEDTFKDLRDLKMKIKNQKSVVRDCNNEKFSVDNYKNRIVELYETL